MPLEATVNLIAYTRVSSDGQLDGFGIDTQERAIASWTKAHFHRIIRTVSDIGVSGATDAVDRPGLSAALEALAAREAQGLVVARLDRLARALTVQEATLAFMWRSGAEVFTADAGQVLRDDPDDPMRTALRQVVGVFAELDRRMVVKRLRDGRAAKSATGRKAVGSYAYGYVGAGKGRQRDGVRQPAEQSAVAFILEARGVGRSYRQIAHALDERGHAPRRAAHWSPASVRSVVMRHQNR
jgi:DNA invertase Pin-like site-specific DNA recombinase